MGIILRQIPGWPRPQPCWSIPRGHKICLPHLHWNIQRIQFLSHRKYYWTTLGSNCGLYCPRRNQHPGCNDVARFQDTRFHTETRTNIKYRINVWEHLTAIDSVSPSRKYQKAITLEFLRCMSNYASHVLLNDSEDHTTDILIIAFFLQGDCVSFLMYQLWAIWWTFG